jgi:hypothetical protein
LEMTVRLAMVSRCKGILFFPVFVR